MSPDDVRLHPHLFDPNAATRQDFATPRPGRGKALSLQARDRAAHAAHLLGQLDAIKDEAEKRRDAQKAAGVDGGHGIYIQFQGDPGFDLKFESLEFGPSKIELCAVRTAPDGRVQATVFVPDGKLEFFLKRIAAYRDSVGKVKNRELVEGVADVQVAALEALWTDDRALIPDFDQPANWEAWLRRSANVDHLARFREVAAAHDLTVSDEAITFIDRR